MGLLFILIGVILIVSALSDFEKPSKSKELCKVHKWVYGLDNKMYCDICDYKPDSSKFRGD